MLHLKGFAVEISSGDAELTRAAPKALHNGALDAPWRLDGHHLATDVVIKGWQPIHLWTEVKQRRQYGATACH